ncbi:MMPL family transporter [Micromonospora sp. HM5-17]|jgi:RND superfamily putative drug exporter|uniref:MMPL family transporter n=1 Tax=Micromonospora sp. HM5-17 TaxID=2487710 RepID=UPI000F4641CE|nr:MMPL family transporter [Micromonospora sp. HM5-17]ROT32757.1 MMPL family transporter [Micromonospora sp. HM5-17]
MFLWWGRAVVRLRWAVLAAALALVALGATWGSGVFGTLTGAGYDDPDSESSRAAARITAEVGNQNADLVVLYSSPTSTLDQPAFRDPVTAALERLRQRPEVESVTSWYETQAPNLVSHDRHATYAVVRLRATDPDEQQEAYDELRPALEAPGVTTQAGGTVAFLAEANAQISEDVTRAEAFSLPVLLVLLVLIFRGLVAAATPLLIGGLAILGAFIATRLLAMVTDISVFAINIITLIGLGMAVDYALFIVSRFREELAAGHPVPSAIARTMSTAGRTVMVSGLTIATALASLLIFPQAFLTSMGLGGMAAVLVAMLASLTVLPALLAVLGPRINALAVPLPRWRRAARARTGGADQNGRADGYAAGATAAGTAGVGSGAWARLAHSVMRRPVLYLVGVITVLAVLATPFFRMEAGGFGESVLPTDATPRVVTERIAAEFPGGSVAPISVLVSGADVEQARQFAAEVDRLPGVTEVAVTANRGDSTLLSVTYEGEPTGSVAEEVVHAIRALPDPAGAEVLVGGRTAADVDMLESLTSRLPLMAAIMAAATLVLLFLAFGSVLLPIKAVLMNLVSIGASFGVVVWIFQDGHFADWLDFTPTGFIEPSTPILMLAVLFGLATDYEVFLLSRVREEWDRTGDNVASVATGLQHTGRIITAAALLLGIVVAGFATGGVASIKLIGIGMIVAIAVDATLVRALLVPATMRLLGRWNWWAPGPLARVYRRYGIRESAGEPADPSQDAHRLVEEAMVLTESRRG